MKLMENNDMWLEELILKKTEKCNDTIMITEKVMDTIALTGFPNNRP